MNRLFRFLSGAAFCIMSVVASAQADLVYERFFGTNSQFDKVAIDDFNNVYCLGRATLQDAIVLGKYSATGTTLWVALVTPTPSFTNLTPIDLVVDSSGATYILYRSGATGSLRARVRKVNANGSSPWDKVLELPSGSWLDFRPYRIHLDNVGKVCVVYTRSGSFNVAQWRYKRFTSAGVEDAATGATSSFARGVANDSVMTADGRTILRFGATTTANPSGTSTIQSVPPLLFPINMPYATHLAYTPILGGFVFGVGKLNDTTLIAYRVSLQNGATISRTYSTFQLPQVIDTATDPDGRFIVVGDELLNGNDHRAFSISHAFEDLNVYAATRGGLIYPVAVKVDRFGSAFLAESNYPGTVSLVNLIDSISWIMAGSVYLGVHYRATDVAVNSRGFAAAVGNTTPPALGVEVGYVWLIRQTDLMNVTLPLPEYTGGQTVDATIRRYVSLPLALTVEFDSNSAFATVPALPTIPPLSSSVTAPVVLAPTAVDRFVTLEARSSFDWIVRRHKFILKAPRPTSIVLAPASLRGGANSTATVTMTGIAPSGGIRLTLASNNAFAVVPASALVPINQNRVNFNVTTTRPTSTQTATISATYIGVTRSATLTILP